MIICINIHILKLPFYSNIYNTYNIHSIILDTILFFFTTTERYYRFSLLVIANFLKVNNPYTADPIDLLLLDFIIYFR